MANEQYAFLKSDEVPNRTQWQSAIDRTGFDLKLDPDYDVQGDSGFVSCQLDGAESGVEIYFENSVEAIKPFGDLPGDRDCYISFAWGGSMQECACAMVASYALAESFGAIVSYEGEPPHITLQQFREETQSVVADVAKDT